jgi:hypothetical protein
MLVLVGAIERCYVVNLATTTIVQKHTLAVCLLSRNDGANLNGLTTNDCPGSIRGQEVLLDPLFADLDP